MGILYGYIRVSTREQNEDRQILALKDLSIPEKNLFIISNLARILNARSTGKWYGN